MVLLGLEPTREAIPNNRHSVAQLCGQAYVSEVSGPVLAGPGGWAARTLGGSKRHFECSEAKAIVIARDIPLSKV